MLRLVLLVVLFLVSLLAVIRAPQYHLWLLAIAVTEFPWIWMLLTTALLLLGIWTDKYVLAGTVVGAVALILFVSPVVRIYAVASGLGDRLDAVFGKVPHASDTPFSPVRMITGINTQQDTPQTFFYRDRLAIEFFKARQQGSRPCVIVVHGGSWAGGDSRQLPELNTELAKAGYHVAAINYRLAPFYKSPAQVDDLRAALQYLRSHAVELGIDTAKFVLLGRSAGAQITLVASYTFHDPSIVGTISYYGPADMVWGYSLPANPLVFDSRKVMVDYLAGTYEQVPQQYFNSSAIEFVTPQAPPTLLIHGPLDPLVAYEHSVRLDKKLEDNKVPHYFLSLPCGTHGCDYTLNGPSGQVATYSVLHFMESICNK